MDKLKAQLAPVLQYWFWITAALVLLGSVGIWWVSSGRLITEFESARNKIETDAKSVSAVSAKLSEHPNPKTQEEMEKLIKARKKAVLDAWTSVYERQRAILVWPVEELQEDFVREFRDLVPIEEKVQFPTPEEDEKETSLLNRYSYYIGNVLPGIAEIGRTKWTADFQKAASAGSSGMEDRRSSSMPTSTTDDGPLVKWDTASQESLMKDLFPWKITGQPTTLDVLYSQENLWILRQLMQIIADVNGDVGQRFQAKIHEINQIAIGSSVKTSAGTISKPSMDAMAAGMGSMGGYGSSEGSMGGMDSAAMAMGMAMSMDGAMGATDPGDNRYIDKTGTPLTAAQLRSALASSSPEDASIAVAKRVPVMMSLKMDQRAVPDLIAKCGSAALMVEVRQVRVLPKGINSTSSMSGSEGGSSSSSYGESMGRGSGGESSMGAMPSMAATVRDPFPFDLDVEIYGVINIYNPPFEEKLGVEKVTEETVVDGTAMVDGRKVEDPATARVPEPTAGVPASDVTAPVAPATDLSDPAAVPPAAELPAPGSPTGEVPATVPPAAATPATAPPAATPPTPAGATPVTAPPAVTPLAPAGAAAEPAAASPPVNLPAGENAVPPAAPAARELSLPVSPFRVSFY